MSLEKLRLHQVVASYTWNILWIAKRSIANEFRRFQSLWCGVCYAFFLPSFCVITVSILTARRSASWSVYGFILHLLRKEEQHIFTMPIINFFRLFMRCVDSSVWANRIGFSWTRFREILVERTRKQKRNAKCNDAVDIELWTTC